MQQHAILKTLYWILQINCFECKYYYLPRGLSKGPFILQRVSLQSDINSFFFHLPLLRLLVFLPSIHSLSIYFSGLLYFLTPSFHFYPGHYSFLYSLRLFFPFTSLILEILYTHLLEFPGLLQFFSSPDIRSLFRSPPFGFQAFSTFLSPLHLLLHLLLRHSDLLLYNLFLFLRNLDHLLHYLLLFHLLLLRHSDLLLQLLFLRHSDLLLHLLFPHYLGLLHLHRHPQALISVFHLPFHFL